MAYRVGNFSQPVEGSFPWIVESPVFCSQEVPKEGTPPTQSYEPDSPAASLSLEEDGYLRPELRFPLANPNHDTVYIDPDFTLHSVHGSGDLFIEEKHIVKRHVMKYVDCPPFPATSKVVAMTREEKHIIWQQAIRSCVPTAISMIALDVGKPMLSKEITYAVTSADKELDYIRQAGFQPLRVPLGGEAIEKVRKLEKVIDKTGPGLLHLDHPELKSHVVVLDAISSEKFQATVREPYHGYMVTVKLFPFMNWIGEEFMVLSKRQN